MKRISVVIYHAPNYVRTSGKKGKVGCTQDLEHRKKEYDMGRGVKILERLENVTTKEAGDREWYWADKLGYRRGNHYIYALIGRINGSKIGGPRGGTANVRSGHLRRISHLGGKVTGRRNVETGQVFLAAAANVSSPNHITKQKFTCQYCNRIGIGPSIFRHIRSCKEK